MSTSDRLAAGAAGTEVTGSLDAPGLDRALRRQLQHPVEHRRRLTAALSPDGLVAMIRAHRVLVVPNPHRERQ